MSHQTSSPASFPKQNRTKILQIVGDSKFGGATYLILRWSEYLLRKQCQVDVLSTDRQTVVELGKIPGLGIIDNILIPRDISVPSDMKAFCQLLRLLRTRQYDVVHTYTATPAFVGRLAAYSVRVPVIVHHQAGWTVTDFSTPMERIIYTPLEYVATLVSTRGICVSHAVKQQAARLHIAPLSKLVTICNGIDPQPFVEAGKNRASLRSMLRIPDGCFVVGSTGRLSPQKDNATLIRGAVRLREILPDLKFLVLLAGNGPDLSQLDALARKLNVTEQVKFLGFCNNIPDFLAALDIFASSSLREGLSISILEAMASALPIVTTNILPNAELIEHEVDGLLVPPRDPAQLAYSIARLIMYPDFARRCAESARAKVLQCYTVDRMFQQTWDLYMELLHKGSPGSI